MIGAFSSFTFKVIIERCILISILLIVFFFFLSSCSSVFLSSLALSALFLGDLMDFFSVMFGLLSFKLLHFYYSFLICGYHEVHV